ncbi:MAG: hypothetical protein U0132_02180 [Gemmatimonadaceae bacterium]
MRTEAKQNLQVLRRAHDFLVDLEVTPTLGSIKKHVDALGASVDRLAAHAVDQDENQRAFRAAATSARELARSLRIECMRPIARISQTLFPNDAALRQSLRMPQVLDYEGLIAAALSMAGRAQEHKDRFVSAGFEEDFVDRLKKAAAALRDALDVKGSYFGKRTASTRGVLNELARGRQMVRVLDDMVSLGLRATPERLARWKALSRFVRASAPTVTADEGSSPAGAPTGSAVGAGAPAGPAGSPAGGTATVPLATGGVAPGPVASNAPPAPNATVVAGGPLAQAA